MNNIYTCGVTAIHEEVVKHVKENMLDDNKITLMAEFFKVFGDSTRLKVLYALSISEMCVCDISSMLDMKQSAISHQLKILRQARLIKYRRDGKVVYYSLNDDHIKQIMSKGLAHVSEK